MQARDPNHARGLDVSWYQGRIDWPQVRGSGYSFAFVKVTEGSTMTDANYATNLTGAKAAGLAVGAYHFLHAKTPQEAIREADFYINAVSSAVGFDALLPPVVDVEVSYSNVSAIRTWIDRVKEKTGKSVIIYTNAQYLDMYLSGGKFSDCLLWYAMYGNDQPADRDGWTQWTFFQYTDRGQVPGINAPCDINEFEGSEEMLYGTKLSQEAAEKFISFCKYQYDIATNEKDKNMWHDYANEARKCAGIPEE